MNNADLIVQIIKSSGINHGFGIPSGNVLPLMEAMRTGGIEFVLTAHEGSAAFCADVTGRMTGRPGLCIATLGPGATNLTTGVGSAFLDRSPLLAITCNLNVDQLGRRIQMYIDHHALFKPITKASYSLRQGEIVATVEAALRTALSEPRGPVHLDLPEDVALAPADDASSAVVNGAINGAPLAPATDKSVFAKAEHLIRGATRPLAVIGASAMRMNDPAALQRFVEKHNIPFASTTMAKGLVDEDHPLAIGCIERARRQIQREFLRSADLIIGLGYDTIEVEYEAWIGDVALLQIDIEPVDTAASVNLACEIVGDLDHSLAQLESIGPAANQWEAATIEAHRQAFHHALRPATDAFTPHEIIDLMRQRLPADGILAFDVGAHTHQIASQWTAHAPRSFLITNGWSSMGFGIPSAIAAKLAVPDRAVAGLIGDGCFQMTCGELATAQRLGISLPIVVLDDRSLSLINVKQIRRQYGNSGVDLDDGSLADPPAHYFGVPVRAATDATGFTAAFTDALNAPGPTVIEVKVDPAHYLETVFD